MGDGGGQTNHRLCCRHRIAGWNAALPPLQQSRVAVQSNPTQESTMPKGEQRSNKMQKKPKKDNSPPKESGGSDRPMPPTTSVLPKGKMKKPG
jgi:hypothetical protein